MKDDSLQQSKGCISIAYNFPRLNQEEIENLDRLITSDKSEIVIKNLPANKNSRPDGFTGEFYKTFKDIIPILLNSSKKLKKRETPPNTFYEASMTFIPTPKIHTHTQTIDVSLMNIDAKILNKTLTNQIQQYP